MSDPNPPQTLLRLAGANPQPAPLSRAALVLIDAQMEYVRGRLPLQGMSEALTAARRLLDRARQGGRPIFHIVHHGTPGGALFDPEGPGSAICPELAPAEGEAVIVKSLPNSFARTDLDERLKARNIREIIFAGFMTHMCVESTVRAALDLGYQSTVVAAACATRDLPDGLGGTVPAAVVHRASLAALADRFATVVATADDVPE
jgi:nicotinamidase-related amidase